ncbi:MAG: hypothetical protein LBP54_06030 [Campylobacteraceae bacterium]|jgi:hypothetical protein|nr:hypothetical protein [Campylobacteraceae bacterium]
MKVLANLFTILFSILFLVGCGGGRSSDVDAQLPHIEDSDFFISFALSDGDIKAREKGLIYYPVSDSVFSNFVDNITDQGFQQDTYDETCYVLGNYIADACSDIADNRRWIGIWLYNTTTDTTDEEIAEFFPKIDAPLSVRVLYIEFDDNKSETFSAHENYLKNTLGFDYYDDNDYTKCLKKHKDDIIYSFCYDNEDNDAIWFISRKILFDVEFF